MEVAYTIREDYHRLGLGSILHDRLKHYAKKMGFKVVAGYVFEDNVAMLRTFARKGRYKGDVVSDGVIRVWRVFEEGVGRRETRGRRMVSSPN